MPEPTVKKTGNIYGYCRVSTKEQNLDRQLIAMKENGVPENNIYCDKQSGKILIGKISKNFIESFALVMFL